MNGVQFGLKKLHCGLKTHLFLLLT